MPRCDVAVVCLKATQNHLLGDILPHVLNQTGIVLLLQNGYGEEEPISRLPGVRTIVAGLCFICSSKLGPGHIHHQDYGNIRLAQYTRDNHPAGVTDVLSAITADFTTAGIGIDLDEDHCMARWKKLVWNIPFNGLSVALDADTAQLVTNPAWRARVIALMGEVVQGAASFGRRIEESFVQRMISNTEKMRPYYPSMKLDFDAGRPLEIQSMYANPLQAVATQAVQLPQITRLHEELRSLAAARDAESARHSP
jgi:2-dehydropantoate 2-reductase